MADTFTQAEHSDLARHLIARSGVHFDAGRPLEGAETLWGAAAHALIAAALAQGWRYDSHGALKRTALRLPDISGQPEWHSEFDVAEKFHTHFYHGRLNDRQIAADRPKVRRFVNRLLAYLADNPG